MSKVHITYLGANGVYRFAAGTMETAFPTLVTNKKDEMRHTISEGPIWGEERSLLGDVKRVKLSHFHELQNIKPPAAPQTPTRLRMVCEDNSFYPLTVTSVDFTRRHYERNAHKEAGVQRSRTKASKTNEANGLMNAVTFAVIGAVVVLTLLIALLVVATIKQEKARQEPAPVESKTAAMINRTAEWSL